VTTLLDDGADERITLDDEARREFLEVINEEADRLNRLIENMVELARIEAERSGCAVAGARSKRS
jgi:signal transduction histidine kinase